MNGGFGESLSVSPPLWGRDDEGELRCVAVRPETHDVKTFVFTPPQPRQFRFLPGQFITLELVIGGETIYRSYTISSPPTRPDRLTITVKRVPGGPVSNWLHDHLRPGDRITATGPMGDFTAARHPAGKYLFLSAGSGVTPLMSMTRTAHDLGLNTDICFVHSARSPADIIFRRELEDMARGGGSLKVSTIVEADSDFEAWTGYRGRLSAELLKQIAPDFAAREIFTCGPAPYMASVRAILTEAGFDMTRYHEESFVFEDLAPADDAPIATAAQPESGAFKVAFAKSGETIDCGADRFVLEVARLSGLRLPSSCTKGMCGTCKSKLLSGQVDMQHAGGIRPREIEQGLILLCCSKPLSDLVVDR